MTEHHYPQLKNTAVQYHCTRHKTSDLIRFIKITSRTCLAGYALGAFTALKSNSLRTL